MLTQKPWRLSWRNSFKANDCYVLLPPHARGCGAVPCILGRGEGMQSIVSARSTSNSVTSRQTRALLLCGVVAGPLFTVVGLIQASTRPGFDLRRHALSALENGELGWIQRGSFLL